MSIAREIQTLKKRAERVLMAESPPELGLIVYSEGDATPMKLTPWELSIKIDIKRANDFSGAPLLRETPPEEKAPRE